MRASAPACGPGVRCDGRQEELLGSNDESMTGQVGGLSASRVARGTVIISVLGTFFGMLQVVGGSFMIWRSDPVLGLYSETGWNFHNLVAGDGKISMVLGTVAFLGLVLGAVLRRKVFYAVTFACSLVLLALSVYELVFLFTRSGVVSPGAGVYMLLGGSVVGVLAGLGGYFMIAEKIVERE